MVGLVHPIFHVSMLRKCIGDPTTFILLECLVVYECISYEFILKENFRSEIEKVEKHGIKSHDGLMKEYFN